MAGFWDVVTTGWNVVTGDATFSDFTSTASRAYEGSFLDRALSGDLLDKTKTAAEIAGQAKTLLYGEKGMPQFGTPKGQRLSSGSRSAVSSGSYKASAVDLGYTAKVQNAVRAASNARAGSVIAQTVQQLRTRPAKGPLLQLGTTPIKVTPRARG